MIPAAVANATSGAAPGPSPESRLILLAAVLGLSLLLLVLLLLFTIARNSSRVRALRRRVKDLEEPAGVPGPSPWSLAGRRVRAAPDDGDEAPSGGGSRDPEDPVGWGGP